MKTHVWFRRWSLRLASLATALCLSAAGCTQDSSSTQTGGNKAATDRPQAKPEVAPDKMGDATGKQAPPPTGTTTVQTASNTKPAPDPAKIMDPASPMSDDDRRQQAEDLIYATIRVKMEEAIANRAKLLQEGRDPADPQIRQLEGTIMRARDLLIEAGEVVEDVDPPIVQKATP